MSARAPIVLAVLVVLLAGYIIFFERDKPRRNEVEARTGFLVEPLVRERVSHLEVFAPTGTVALAREGAGFDETWTLEAPDESPADPEEVENYLRSWEFAVATRTLEDPTREDLESFGLDTPTASVRFTLGRARVELSLGSGSPVDGGGYLQITGDDRVMVVPDAVVELFDVDAERFRIRADGGAPDLDDLLEGEAPQAPPARTGSDPSLKDGAR